MNGNLQQTGWRRIAASWLPGIIYAAIIFCLSSQSSFDAVSFIHISDKVVHAILYAGLSTALYLGASRAPIPGLGGAYMQAFLLAILYGATDEFHQSFVPRRSMDIMDWFADVSGAIFALCIIAVYTRIGGRKHV